jgi:hypothetical protein
MMPKMRRFWTQTEIDTLRALYPNTLTRDIAARIGRSVRATYHKALTIGLAKDPEFIKSSLSRIRKGSPRGIDTRFKPGHRPHNKGVAGWQAGGQRAG